MNKIFVTFAVLSIFGAVLVKGFDKKEALAKLMVNVEDCKGQVGAQESDITELISKKPATTMEGKCLRACLMKIFKVMDSNGKFVKSVAIEHAQKFTDGDAEKLKIANEMIDACVGISVPDDHCEASGLYDTCLLKQAEAHGILEEFAI